LPRARFAAHACFMTRGADVRRHFGTRPFALVLNDENNQNLKVVCPKADTGARKVEHV
jgi:hypothetical protein